ncbi:MAG TPA: helix-turn-helix transcriptional regulator [Thermoanaerobaculia bacterium]|nr:helix-turn-helix transcriptional regulator [Thermoanaerobaculia bacterium]
MTYREFAPAAALAPWVECFWTRSGDASERVVRVLPDGCADLVFDLTAEEGMAVGTMTAPLEVRASDHDFLGVRFRPGRAAAFLRLPLADITDAHLPVRDLHVRDVVSLETELLRRLARAEVPEPRVDAAVDRIMKSGGAQRVEEIADDIGISRQHLARQFQRHVGVSPKMFARVMRFRRTMESLRSDETIEWADVAVRHGYYDQSHLIAEFRELAGDTPNAFHFSNR